MAASSRFVLPRQQYIQSNSVIGAGWRLYFYASGTSTPQNVFSDAGLTTPIDQTNGIASDGDGNFPDIFLGALAYKVLLIAPLATVGSPTWTADPVQATTVSNATTGAAGIVQLATTAQALAAASATLAMTPVTTAAMIQQGGYAYAGNGSGSANAEVAALNPAPSAYASGMIFLVRAGFTNTGAMTANFNTLGAVAVKKQGAAGATPLIAGDYVLGNLYLMVYVGADSCLYLFESAGSFMQAPTLPGVIGFVATNKVGSEDTQITVNPSADTTQIVLIDTSGNGIFVSSAATLTMNSATVGVNGIDVGGLVANTWYYLWYIYNQSTATLALLLSTSPTAPTMPSGYTYKVLAGAAKTDGTSKFYRFRQNGADWQYVVVAATNVPNFPNMTVGTGLNNSSTTIRAASGAAPLALCPPLARKVRVFGNTTNAANALYIINPNGNNSNVLTAPANPGPMGIVSNGFAGASIGGELVLESDALFITTGAGGTPTTNITGFTLAVNCR